MEFEEGPGRVLGRTRPFYASITFTTAVGTLQMLGIAHRFLCLSQRLSSLHSTYLNLLSNLLGFCWVNRDLHVHNNVVRTRK